MADMALDSTRQESLARLVPSLLCGEQSAQFIFHAQVQRNYSALSNIAEEFRRIEFEEDVHERALQCLAAELPVPADLHLLKRRSQRFYTALSRDASLGQHFARIAALDSCVCRIMASLAQAQGSRHTGLYHLFTRIKQDEARHVGVSRRCAAQLSINDAGLHKQRREIGNRIVEFLLPEADEFESLGVDADILFKHLAGSA